MMCLPRQNQISQGNIRSQQRKAIVALGMIFLILGAIIMIDKLESKFLYKPTKKYTTIHFQKCQHRFVRINTRDNVKLSGLLVENERAEYYILYFPDNTGNVSLHTSRIELLCTEGFSVLALDYRGFGQSEGTPSEDGLYEDALSAYQYLLNKHNVTSESIILLGRSLGGAIAIELATHVPVKALIVESSFSSLTELQKDRMPFIPIWLVLPKRYNSLEKIGDIDAPILFLHGDRDSSIPLKHSQILFEAASMSKTKQFRILKGSDHFNTFQNKDYIVYIKSFLEGLE